MSSFDQYANRYETVKMERRDGILQITLHTNGDTLQWGMVPHHELPRAFYDIGDDPENRVVIMTGAGDAFSGPRATPGTRVSATPQSWSLLYRDAKQLLMNLLDIEAPMISAINGPALRHSELPLLCDIVLAADDVVFQDSAHFVNGLVPGDGMHVVMPLLLGPNRGRYFLLTGQEIDAARALELGLVSETMPRERLLPRAWELAEQLVRQPAVVTRFSRVAVTQLLKQQMLDLLGYGLVLEGLGVVDDED